jgi:hypothetical protein
MEERTEHQTRAMANTLNLYRNGAVGFIGWLGLIIAITIVASWASSEGAEAG